MKYTDPAAVRQLAIVLLKEVDNLLTKVSELDSKLKALEGTFLDDGIEEVKTFVKYAEGKLSGIAEYFETIAGELNAYAELLEQGK